MSGQHCATCTCEADAERRKRYREERAERERKEREAEFVARHSVLTDDDLAWARSRLPGTPRPVVAGGGGGPASSP